MATVDHGEPARAAGIQHVLVLGATGYVGGRLVPRLLAAGYQVRCLVRSPEKLRGLPWAADVEVAAGNLLDADTVPAAFTGVDAVYHLVHSIGGEGSFSEVDRRIAHTVAAAAASAHVRRVVYLGGLGELGADTSAHLRSRAEVGDILTAGSVPTTVLRAAVIIGSGSASFEMLRHLVERLPVMVTPRWVDTRVQPIAIRDVLRYLVAALVDDGRDHRYDIAGPDVLTYRAMMRQYAELAGLRRRLVLGVPVLTPWLSSHWIGLVTPVPPGLAKPLIHSLAVEVVARGGEDLHDLDPDPPLSYRHALRLALQRIRDHEVETSFREAEGRDPAAPYPGDPAWSGGTLLRDVQTATAPRPATAVFATVTGIGGDRGWPTHGWAWGLRGLIDQVVGGVGLRRGRRDPHVLRVGDALDFWRVEEVRAPRRAADPLAGAGLLRLQAEMRLPGRAWLEFRIVPQPESGAGPVDPDVGATVLRQRALFAPRGVLGRLYWWAMLPFHAAIFSSMVRTLAHGDAADD